MRGRWTDLSRREEELPALGLRRGEESRRFESLPDARFGRDPAVWRATYLVPAALMDPGPDEFWLSWESGARAGLPEPAHGFEPPATPPAPPEPEPGGEVIDRAVLAERRARRAEAAERAQAQRAAEALKAVEVLELRSAELERRLEALQAQPPLRWCPTARGGPPALPPPAPEPALPEPAAVEPSAASAALSSAVGAVKRLRGELEEQRQRLRKSELLRAADAVALATLRDAQARAQELRAGARRGRGRRGGERRGGRRGPRAGGRAGRARPAARCGRRGGRPRAGRRGARGRARRARPPRRRPPRRARRRRARRASSRPSGWRTPTRASGSPRASRS